VIVGLREGSPSRARAEAAGLAVSGIAEAVARGDVIVLLVPDESQPDVFARDVQPNLRWGAYLAFAHGFSVHFRTVVPPDTANVFMVAPKGIGPMVRREYVASRGVPALLAVHHDPSGDTHGVALAYACAIGCGRAGVLETTFRDEAETDLFGEQAVLCGGLPELIRAGFETLTQAGYPPELAYFECLHEVKLIADLIYERGIAGMREATSNTAAYGGLMQGRRVIGDEARDAMSAVLADVQSGTFATKWMAECAAGQPTLRQRAREEACHAIEQVGTTVRRTMPMLDPGGGGSR
jgi:ketol-acid reductoisomerase